MGVALPPATLSTAARRDADGPASSPWLNAAPQAAGGDAPQPPLALGASAATSPLALMQQNAAFGDAPQSRGSDSLPPQSAPLQPPAFSPMARMRRVAAPIADAVTVIVNPLGGSAISGSEGGASR